MARGGEGEREQAADISAGGQQKRPGGRVEKVTINSRRQVSYDEAKQFAQQNDIGFMETSARANLNVD